MSAVASDAHLSQREKALLDELASAVASAPLPTKVFRDNGPVIETLDTESAGELDGAACEAFSRHFRILKARHMRVESRQKRSRWQWIDEMHSICASTCLELEDLLGHLTALEEQRREVVRKTTALHEKCEQMVNDQDQLGNSAECIAQRLDLFDRVGDVARILDQGSAATSHPDFASVLDQLDGSIAFLEAHSDFCQAQTFLHQFEHLRNRACISVKAALQKSLEKSTSQVEAQLKDKGASEGPLDTQVLYTRFRAAALAYKPLMALLQQRVEVHETYATTLEELEAFYVHTRVRLVSGPVSTQLAGILHRDLQMAQLAPATRQASTYILDVSHFERQCFEAYFELRQPQEALKSLLETVADIFYKSVRPVVLACDSIDSLREMADCIQIDVLEPHEKSQRSDLMPVLAMAYRLHKDVQEKLIFRVQTYIRDEIRGFQVSAGDLSYPAVLFPAVQREATAAANGLSGVLASQQDAVGHGEDLREGWFPVLRRSLEIMSKIYNVLETSTFQGLAQETVDICIASLKDASQRLAHRPLKDRSHPLGPLVQMMDSQLFLLKHLLILREQVAAFDVDLVVQEKYVDFSNVWEALHLKLPDGLLGILKPKLQQSQVDSRKDIEAELKAACELLIMNLTANITQPLAALNAQIGDFLATPGADRTKLKDQPFMSFERLREIIAAFLANVRDRVPFAAAHIRVYLLTSTAANAGDRAAATQSTAAILFKPVQVRLVDTWGRLEGLLEEWQLDVAQLNSIGFVRPDVLREMVASLFNAAMEAPWLEMSDVVSQVARMEMPAAFVAEQTAEVSQLHAGTDEQMQRVPGAATVPADVASVASAAVEAVNATTEAACCSANANAATHAAGTGADACTPVSSAYSSGGLVGDSVPGSAQVSPAASPAPVAPIGVQVVQLSPPDSPSSLPPPAVPGHGREAVCTAEV